MYEKAVNEINTRIDIVRDGIIVGELTADLSSPPIIKMNTDSEIKMAFSGKFIKDEKVDFLFDRLHPNLILNGKVYPLGEYIVSTAEEMYEGGESYIRIEAYDQNILAKRSSIEERITIRKGERYTDVIQGMLINLNIKRLLIEKSDLMFQTDREDWEIGTSWLEIINQLLNEINYQELWFDFDGYAILQKYQTPSAGNIAHVYQSGELSIIGQDYTSSMDIYSKYNVFTAVVENPELPEPIRETAVNDDPDSPLSTVKQGRIQAPVERLDNISSREALKEYVENKKFMSMLSTETVNIKTALNPAHKVGETIALSHEKLHGIFTETNWVMQLSCDGDMEHTLKRVMYL